MINVAGIVYDERMELLLIKKNGVWSLPFHPLSESAVPQADIMEYLCDGLGIDQVNVKEKIHIFEHEERYDVYQVEIKEYFTLKKAPLYLKHEVEELRWWSKQELILSDEPFFVKDRIAFIKAIQWEEAAKRKYKLITERINENSRFLRNNNMQIISMEDGLAKVELDISEDLFNVHGFVHGGAMFSLADNTAGAAAFSKGRKCVTLTGNINYIKPGTAGKLIGVAHEVSCGRTTGVYDVHIFNEKQQLLAKATFTMFFLSDERK